MPISAVESLTPAFEHTKQQLFRPFRLGQWTKLAFVGLLAGEASTFGGGGPNFNVPASTSTSNSHLAAVHLPHIDPAVLIPVIVALAITLPILWLVLLYISSRMRFILFDSVVERRCDIVRMWRARSLPALRYWVWQILFSLIGFFGFILIVGIPALAAFLLGWFSPPRQHVASLVLTGIAVFIVFCIYLVAIITVHVFTKDFVVPQMALEDVSAFEGWRRLLLSLRSEKAGYAGYAGMKIVMAMGAALAVAFLALILILLLAIPLGGLGFIAVILGKGAGLTWTVWTVTAAIVAGCLVVALLLYGIALISVPVIVFFPAYSIYFFASRYPSLAQVIYPAPPASPMTPSPEPAV